MVCKSLCEWRVVVERTMYSSSDQLSGRAGMEYEGISTYVMRIGQENEL